MTIFFSVSFKLFLSLNSEEDEARRREERKRKKEEQQDTDLQDQENRPRDQPKGSCKLYFVFILLRKLLNLKEYTHKQCSGGQFLIE